MIIETVQCPKKKKLQQKVNSTLLTKKDQNENINIIVKTQSQTQMQWIEIISQRNGRNKTDRKMIQHTENVKKHHDSHECSKIINGAP
jgi:hypothetical protein